MFVQAFRYYRNYNTGINSSLHAYFQQRDKKLFWEPG